MDPLDILERAVIQMRRLINLSKAPGNTHFSIYPPSSSSDAMPKFLVQQQLQPNFFAAHLARLNCLQLQIRFKRK